MKGHAKLAILLLILGIANSLLSLAGTSYRSPEWLALLSPLARVFVQPGFFQQKFFVLSTTDQSHSIPYIAGEDLPQNRMIYMLAQFADTIPAGDQERIVQFEICRSNPFSFKPEKKIRKVELHWKENNLNHQRAHQWSWLCL